jgi:6-phosphogluconolactonase
VALALLSTALACAAAPPPPPPALAPAVAPAPRGPLVYVSGYRPEILAFRLDVERGTLTPVGRADGGKGPSYLAFDPRGRYVYAVNEGTPGKLLSFAVDRATGALTRLGEASSEGLGPAHISVDATGKWVLVANYAGGKHGTVAVLPVAADGRLGPAADKADFGHDTNPHFIQTDPTNRFAFVPCKGGPFVTQLRFDPSNGRIELNDHDRIKQGPKGGPRHLAFHPSRKFAYVINELDSTMTAYAFDAAAGRLSELHTLSTLPAEFTGRNSGADVHVHPSGKFVYGSNRGHDSIAIFALGEDGRMTVVGHETQTIKTPRNFHIDPTGKLLLVASQAADTVTVFRIDPASGALEQVGAPVPAGKAPTFVGVLPTSDT